MSFEARQDMQDRKTTTHASTSSASQSDAPEGREAAMRAFKRAAGLPVVTSASIQCSGDAVTVHTTLSAASFDSFSKHISTQTRVLARQSDGSLKLVSTSAPAPQDCLHFSRSPSGRKSAVFRKREAGGIIVEIYSADPAEHVEGFLDGKKVTSLYTDDTFGQPSWSQDEEHIAFVAEAAPSEDPLDKLRYTQDWGETFVGKRAPRIFVASHVEDTLHIRRLAEPESKGVTWAQPVFGPKKDDHLVLFVTGIEALGDGFRLGQVFCTNRPSRLWRLELSLEDADFIQPAHISSQPKGKMAYRSPRVSDDTLVFLGNPHGGEHDTCSSLFVGNTHYETWLDASERVQAVEVPGKTGFPGIYAKVLVQSCFLVFGKDKHVIVTSAWGSELALLIIRLDDGRVVRMPTVESGSSTLHATDGRNVLVLSRSSVSAAPRLVLFEMGADPHLWSKPCELSKGRPAENFQKQIIQLPTEQPSEMILVSPQEHPEGLRLVVAPHGGPHSTFYDVYSSWVVPFVEAGFAVALINYEGSLGFGRKALRSLLGKIGELEVETTRLAAVVASKELGIKDGTKHFFYGGSHAGFIGAHLSARCPEEYAAVALRNPVIDFVSNTAETDIPDWCYAESGLPYDYEHPPRGLTQQAYETMRRVSPMTALTKLHLEAKAPCKPPPTYLFLGANDKRVATNQLKQWSYALRQAGAEVDVFVFPEDGHALDGVEASLRVTELALRLFISHRQQS